MSNGKRNRWELVMMHTVIGLVAGCGVLHPVSMAIHDAFDGASRGIAESLIASFSVHHVPMAVYFSLLGALGGAAYGFHNQRLAVLRDRLAELSLVDELTSVHNRRYFNEHLSREVARSERHDEPVSLLMIDVDRFKALNDALGHQRGDAVLTSVGRAISIHARGCDFVARFGGDEFAVIMPKTTKSEAARLAERLRKSFADLGADAGPMVTLSIGVAESPGDAPTAARLLDVADHALYEAKMAGRDRVCVVAEPDVPDKNAPDRTASA